MPSAPRLDRSRVHRPARRLAGCDPQPTVALRQRCRQSFSDLDLALKQRHDLVPNLVETVEGYARHEKGTLGAVVKARNAATAAARPAAQALAEGRLQGTLRQLLVLAEA